ncbi:ATP-binding protein [Nitratidesulfovibrio vulgaris]|uniref:ATP-binding protein n=1 Tax=Nitratidesulfovibrio vulgaris TaxID=881 RepID=UPI0013DF4DF8|nr:ATP-binding protein [Nitratidesulfovibrio vulgaris]
MKQFVVISGKGGTGKTSVTAGLAAVGKDMVLADCDVDAADLHLVLAPEIRERHDFISGVVASIDPEACISCGLCSTHCRYGAIPQGDAPQVAPEHCEGCGVCAHVCPTGAARLSDRRCGEWYVSDTRFGPMVHAALGIGEENSGKLVSTVRTRARELAEARNASVVLIDGSPGVGCPVIASLAGADAALAVTEPTVSALHDLERVHALARHFDVRMAVLLNKADIHPGMAERIIGYCTTHDLPLVGRFGFSPLFVQAQLEGRTLPEQDSGEWRQRFNGVWNQLLALV